MWPQFDIIAWGMSKPIGPIVALQKTKYVLIYQREELLAKRLVLSKLEDALGDMIRLSSVAAKTISDREKGANPELGLALKRTEKYGRKIQALSCNAHKSI